MSQPVSTRFIPLRHLFGLLIGGFCFALIGSKYVTVVVDNESAWGGTVPSPGYFLKMFLELPGTLAGFPLIAIGAFTDNDQLVELGFAVGATLFWYSVGWYLDVARGTPGQIEPPRIVRHHMSALMISCAVILPLGALAGMRVGDHMCANGAPPYWASVLTYGIVMCWLTVGAFFAWRRFRRKSENGH